MNENDQVIQIPIEDLVPNRFQPRISFDEKALNDLANSIKQHGIIQPLVVRRLGDKYEIIAGERRYKAAQIAGLISVPGIIANVNDQSSAEIALVENVQRKDLSAIEEARSYKNILDAGDMTQDELAKKMGISQSAVANKLRLLNLSEEVQNALLEGKISERHARSLLAVSDFETQSKLLRRIIEERLTVRQLDDLIKQINGTNDVLDDVPLVNIDENIEEIQKQATDINPQINRVNYVENTDPNESSSDSKFFKFKPSEEMNIFQSSEVDSFGRPQLMPNETNNFFNFGNDTSAPIAPSDDGNSNPNIQTPPLMPHETKFFEFGSDSPDNDINSVSESDESPVAVPFDNIVEEVLDVDTPVENTNPTNEIESLDVDNDFAIFDTSINDAPTATDIPGIINQIRNLVNNLNTNNNISIEELNLDNSYKINIEIKKDS